MYRKPRYCPEFVGEGNPYGTRLRTRMAARDRNESEESPGPRVKIIKLEEVDIPVEVEAQTCEVPQLTQKQPVVKREPPSPSPPMKKEIEDESLAIPSATEEDLRIFAKRRIEKFDPSFLRKAHKEFTTLQNKPEAWNRFSRRAPYTSDLLRKLFQ